MDGGGADCHRPSETSIDVPSSSCGGFKHLPSIRPGLASMRRNIARRKKKKERAVPMYHEATSIRRILVVSLLQHHSQAQGDHEPNLPRVSLPTALATGAADGDLQVQREARRRSPRSATELRSDNHPCCSLIFENQLSRTKGVYGVGSGRE